MMINVTVIFVCIISIVSNRHIRLQFLHCCHFIIIDIESMLNWNRSSAQYFSLNFSWYQIHATTTTHKRWTHWTWSMQIIWNSFLENFILIFFPSNRYRLFCYSFESNGKDGSRKKIVCNFHTKYATFRIFWLQLFIWEWIINWC